MKLGVTAWDVGCFMPAVVARVRNVDNGWFGWPTVRQRKSCRGVRVGGGDDIHKRRSPVGHSQDSTVYYSCFCFVFLVLFFLFCCFSWRFIPSAVCEDFFFSLVVCSCYEMCCGRISRGRVLPGREWGEEKTKTRTLVQKQWLVHLALRVTKHDALITAWKCE